MNDDIKVIDNFLSDTDFSYVVDYCKNASYFYGESDDYGNIPTGENIGKYVTGMVHEILPAINSENKILTLIHNSCFFQFSELKQFHLRRMYVNCFAPGEHPRFHIDTPENVSQLYTCLYYVNEHWDLDEGGETQFYVDNLIYGIPPIPNRMIIFDGSLMHRATSFKNYHRFSIALKYCKDE
jgi:Rps23 Pro-64 3,4-dihydroxylase Tpa1-like proline 4-hydroxylase